mmetsp:Transcript_16030/g.17800  ORF Transcript_16030/g.17800 Transcript_16030/m.17800 type:complete len:243 (-) Transcript_16030:22-750(-)
MYPTENWVDWKFSKVPEGYWDDIRNLRAFFSHVEKEFNLKTLDGWHRVSRRQLINIGGTTIASTWPAMLLKAYPEHPWKMEALTDKDKRSEQRELVNTIKSIFPKDDIVEEAQPFLYSEQGTTTPIGITLDIFVPSRNLAFEYQGEHHYQDSGHFGVAMIQSSRDTEKIALCQKQGITIVPIPYWWKTGDVDSIKATILHFCPHSDLKVPVGAPTLLISPDGCVSKPNILSQPVNEKFGKGL